MVRKAPELLVVVAIVVGVALGAVGLLWPTLAGAQATAPSASRSFSVTSVAPDGELTVTVTASDYGVGGRVEETLPAGFSYVDGSATPSDIRVTRDGQTVRFTMRGTNEITYRVMASSTAGSYTFDGVLKDDDRNSHTVGGASIVTVEAAAPGPTTPSASRSFSVTSVAPDGELTVTVTASDYGAGGRVEETLPAGFSYVDGSATPSDIRVTRDGQTVRFTMRGTNEITYRVMASSTAGSYTFDGVLKDDDRNSHTVGGASIVTVEAAAPGPTTPSASRSFSVTSVAPDGELTVTVTASDYGAGGRVEETLPAGFSYVDGSATPSDIRVTRDGQTVRFTMRGTDEITYRVMASSTAGSYTFDGVLKDENKVSYPVGGDLSVDVGPNAARSFSADSLRTGGSVDVTIMARDYGPIGAVVETLPAGFTYVSSTPASPEHDGRNLTFALLGPNETVTYTVTASSVAGPHTFSGELIDDREGRHTIGGDDGVTVVTPPTVAPTPPPTKPPPTRRTRRRGGGGGGGGFAAPPVSVKPVAEGFISDQTLKVGDAALELSLTDKFKDPRNRALTYAVLASNPAVALAEVKDGYLVITPVGPGKTRIAVTAADPDGRSALQVLTVTVEGPAVQPPPVIIEATPPPATPPPLPTARPVVTLPAPAATLPPAMPTPPATATPSPTEPPPTASPALVPTPAPPAPPEQPSGGFPVWLIIVLVVGGSALLMGLFLFLRSRRQ